MESFKSDCQPGNLDHSDSIELPQHHALFFKMNDSPSQSQLADSAEGEHRNSGEGYRCDYPGCNRVFRFRSTFMHHLVSHSDERPYVCNYRGCTKSYKRSYDLADHILVHTEQRTYKCTIEPCQLTFKTKAGLKYHTQSHENNRRFRSHYPRQVNHFVAQKARKSAEEFDVDMSEEMPINKAKLMKNIDKILAENMELKRLLKVCLKSMSVHQGQLEELKNMLFE